jgi:hypothetical protein
VHDWIPTGRFDFDGRKRCKHTPASFYLLAEDARFLISFVELSGGKFDGETFNEAKKVVNVFHRRVATERPKNR